MPRKPKVEKVAAASTYGEMGGTLHVVPKSRLAALAGVAKRFDGGWRPAREVLVRVRAVPTIFAQLDLGTRVGGWPTDRVSLLHGPTNNGKSALALGLGLSYLRRGHFFAHVDAEMTTPEDWLVKLMGEHASNPAFVAQRPRSYEQTVDSVRSLAETIAEAREKKELPKDTTALIVVDSLRKLVPERLMKAIEKHGADGSKGSIDGMGGRAAMYKAALNSAWLDELTPLLYHAGIGLLLIARESENTNAGPNEPDWKLTGGKGVQLDSSLSCRVTRAEWVKQGSGDDARIIGERIRVRIHKTKIGGKEDRVTDCFFHTSNGSIAPEGFDAPRDLLELARTFGIVTEDKGSWLTWASTGERWNGANQAVAALHENAPTLEMFEREVREAIQGDLDAEESKVTAAEARP